MSLPIEAKTSHTKVEVEDEFVVGCCGMVGEKGWKQRWKLQREGYNETWPHICIALYLHKLLLIT